MRSDPSTVHRGTSDCTGARAGDEYICLPGRLVGFYQRRMLQLNSTEDLVSHPVAV